MSLKDEIIGASDSQSPVPLEIPEWGRTVHIRVMTGEQREQYEDAVDELRGKDGKIAKVGLYRATMAVHCVCDEDGHLLFDASDAQALAKKNAKALMRIFTKSNQVNLLTDSEIEAAAKN